MNSRRVIVESRDGAVYVGGALTLATAKDALDAADATFNAQSHALVFDLSRVDECDSAAVAVLLEWLRRASARGCALAYRNVPARLLQLARISELETILPING